MSYTVPKIDVLVSGTFKSVPYPGNEFPSVQSQSLGGQVLGLFLGIPGVDSTNLGRPLSSGIPIQFLNIVEPGKLYGDRLSSIDLRFGKILRYGNSTIDDQLRHLQPVQREHDRSVPASRTRLRRTTPRSTYLDPLSIMSARFFKISAQFDF